MPKCSVGCWFLLVLFSCNRKIQNKGFEDFFFLLESKLGIAIDKQNRNQQNSNHTQPYQDVVKLPWAHLLCGVTWSRWAACLIRCSEAHSRPRSGRCFCWTSSAVAQWTCSLTSEIWHPPHSVSDRLSIRSNVKDVCCSPSVSSSLRC